MEKIFCITMLDLYASLVGIDVQMIVIVMYVSEHSVPDVYCEK